MKNMNLRLPDDAHAALKALADAEHRSMTNMVIVLIQRAIAEQDRSDSPTP